MCQTRVHVRVYLILEQVILGLDLIPMVAKLGRT